MQTSAPCETHNVGPLERIPLGEARVFSLARLEVAVVRTRDGRVFAVQARCPDWGGWLADGVFGGGTILCRQHGHVYDLATGAPVRHAGGQLRTYGVSVNVEGELLITLAA